MEITLHTVPAVSGISCDALLTDHGRLLFGSFWGRDTAVQEFIARLQLSNREGGLASFTVCGVHAHAGNVENLEKHTGRLTSPIFGKVVHVWIYDSLLSQPDLSGRRAVVLFRGQNTESNADEQSVWDAFKTICPLPLLDAWRARLLKLATDLGWLEQHKGIGVTGTTIELPDEHEELIAERVRFGELRVEGGAA